MPFSICNNKNIIYEIAKFPSAYGVKARWNESINGWLTDKKWLLISNAAEYHVLETLGL